MKDFLKKVCDFIKKYKDIIYIIILIILVIIISKQCTKIDNLDSEIAKQENNQIALNEELSNYKDDLDRMNAEKHAYQLTQEELRDSIGLLKKKNYEYISYINTNMNIKDTVFIETIIKEPVSLNDYGTITCSQNDTIGKSSRFFSVDIPYCIKNDKLFTKDATLVLVQDIYVEGWLERNNKTKETYVHLRSDYPELTFNSGTGIVCESSKEYERSMRKNCGIGIGIGPNIGMSYDLVNKKFVPTVGIGVTIGFTFTPKWAQW